jgi:glucosyl-3-phosphoglycerate synthase
VAARREFFERLPFATGYAVETAMLLHARDALGGTDGMAQVDLEIRRNRHQPLSALAPMAREVLGAVMERLSADGRLLDGNHEPPIERPPYATVRAHA